VCERETERQRGGMRKEGGGSRKDREYLSSGPEGVEPVCVALQVLVIRRERECACDFLLLYIYICRNTYLYTYIYIYIYIYICIERERESEFVCV